jgi:sulfur-carrier protein adenylyltransferase/sulfurtransferase
METLEANAKLDAQSNDRWHTRRSDDASRADRMTQSPPEFSYDAAFERNLGWFTEAEQLALRGKRVAIAGMGGVGGGYLITLTRMGIGAFHIADFDHFSLSNFNRQMGANIATIDRPKVKVMEEMALAINPELRITRFDEGVNTQNLEAFLTGVDLFLDGFDFFVLDIRRKVYARCHELGIPALTAGPVGMGTVFMGFSPQGMSFEQYFRMEGRPELEQRLRFLVGLAPKALYRRYLIDPKRLNLATKSGPSTSAAYQLAAGVAAVMAIKFLLRRGEVKAAPWSHQYDAFRGILASKRLRLGLNGPLQRLKLQIACRHVSANIRMQEAPAATFYPADPVDEILHAARWTPSGDNEQPWRFEKLGGGRICVRINRHVTGNIYHFRNDEPNAWVAGMLMENLRIAASAHGRRVEWRVESGPDPLVLHVQFVPDQAVVPDPLYAALGQRSVDRNRYRTRKLTEAERSELEAELGSRLRIDWCSTTAARWRFAKLSARATDIRLRAPEALPVHREIIDWDVNLSPTKIPAGSLGISRLTLRVMRWAIQDWTRMDRLNRFTGTFAASLQMDYLPILSSAAAFAVRIPADGVRSIDGLLEVGVHIQRFWLTAARLGLALQPAMALLVFADYGQKDLPFTAASALRIKAKRLADEFRRVFGVGTEDFVFMGRIGEPLPRIGACRSVRRPVSELMMPKP